MEFGTGHDVQPGGGIALETSAGTQDLGQATYDSDHDGVGDSVMIIQDDHAYLITDADHDGYADAVRTFDANGHEVDPSSGSAVDDPAGSTGEPGQGSNVLTADLAPGTAVGSAGLTGPALTVPTEDGSTQDVGAATVDLDRDGTADTAVVREADGAVIGYTDRDGDGVADQMTRIGARGDVFISVSDGRGGWEVAATGQLDDAGTLIEDPAPAVGGPYLGDEAS